MLIVYFIFQKKKQQKNVKYKVRCYKNKNNCITFGAFDDKNLIGFNF